MGLSKSRRIQILLAIDSAFFLLELVVGYATHSLALVADSFHMLNDVLSLCVGLWAVQVANRRTTSKMYTYGWQRAETLGALVNGVFLVALCLSIFLEAIQRFVEPQEVSNPKLVLIVGCWGLASNLLGLVLFHDHGHSHGGHGHSHGDAVNEAEQGHSHYHDDVSEDETIRDERGNIADVLPENRVGNLASAKTDTSKSRTAGRVSWEATDDNAERRPRSHHRKRSHGRSRSRGYTGLDEIYVHPASFRNEIIAASRVEDESSTESDEGNHGEGAASDERTPLIGSKPKKRSSSKSKSNYSDGHKAHKVLGIKGGDVHRDHKHSQPKDASKKGGHGHSHGDLNMRGVFLHVMGDALGNVGVIAAALIIWLTKHPWRYYSDPLISLIITVIILLSALPLCKAASRILLQAVPQGLSIDDIKEDVQELPGIVSCHHVHVWQLSDTKLVASLHVQLEFDFKGEGSARYMRLARDIRKCLHEYGIHSSTIQPEFCLDATHEHSGVNSEDEQHGGSGAASAGAAGAGANRDAVGTGPRRMGSKTGSLRDSEADACLLECGDECGNNKQCCTPAMVAEEGSAPY